MRNRHGGRDHAGDRSRSNPGSVARHPRSRTTVLVRRPAGPVAPLPVFEPLEGRVLLTAASDMDPAFGAGGKLVSPLMGSAVDTGRAVAVQSDGKIVVVGGSSATPGGTSSFAIARFNTDGTPDPAFDGDGLAIITDFGSAYAVAIQADGKIVIAGASLGDFALARLNTDGSLDTSFDVDGKLTTNLGSDSDTAYGLAIGPDGKIVAVGAAYQDLAVVRYNADGSLDNTFNPDSKTNLGGKVVTDLGSVDYGYGVALQSDGKIVLAGGSNGGFALVRYATDGKLDTDFDGDGKAFTSFTGTALAYAVAIQSDGKIVAGGYVSSAGAFTFALARYNTDGSPDDTFDEDGKATTDLPGGTEFIRALAIQPDDRIVAAGYWGTPTAGSRNIAVARYTADGSLDGSFHDTGTVITDLAGYDDIGYAAAVQADGRIVVAGSSTTGISGDNFSVVRYESTGQMDSTFGAGGKAFADFPALHDDYARAMAVQPDGKILLAGYTLDSRGWKDFVVARYLADGQMDTSFGRAGRLYTDLGSQSDYAYAMALQSDGRIVVAGSSYGAGGTNFAIARYNADGTPDTTFDGDGKLTTDMGAGYEDCIYALSIQGDGKIVAGGYASVPGFGNRFALARYNPDGSLDSTFGAGGKVITPVGAASTVYALTIQPDGKILAAGTGSGDFALARLNANGTMDTTFDGDGKATVSLSAGADIAYALAIQPDGKIVSAGAGGDGFGLVRLLSTGRLDTSFDGDGRVTTDRVPASPEIAYGVVVQPISGKIVLAGASGGDFAMARYNPDGSMDRWFGHRGIATIDLGSSDDQARALALQSDGMLLAAGYTKVNGAPDFAVVRCIGLAPPASEAGGPYTVLEGTPLTLVGTGTVDFPPIAYEWDLDYDGATFTPDVVGDTATLPALDGPATRTVAFRVTDSLGQTTVDAATVFIANAPPVLHLGNGGEIGENSLFTLTPTASDIGTDTIQFWTIDWGDGQTQTVTGSPTAITHRYIESGVYNISGTATDEDGTYAAGGLGAVVGGGSSDNTFNHTGQVVTDFFLGSATDEARAILILPDGKLLAGGTTKTFGNCWDFVLTSRNADGSADTTFGLNGIVTTDFGPGLRAGSTTVTSTQDTLAGLALQPDGKVVAFGSSHGYLSLARYNLDGSLDITFDGDGKLIMSQAGTPAAVAVQKDGKIVLAATSNDDFLLARLDAAGQLDTSFDTDGILLTDFSGQADTATSLLIQPDDRILAAGYTITGQSRDFALARYMPDGTLDTAFHTDGKVVTDVGGSDGIAALAIDSTGRIVAAGTAWSAASGAMDFALARYKSDGSLDVDFDKDGKLITDLGASDSISAVVIDTHVTQDDQGLEVREDKIVAGGASGSKYVLVRYKANGTLDTTFDTDGRAAYPSSDGAAYALAIQGDKMFVSAGSFGGDLAIVRHKADGALDTSFDGDGQLTINLPASAANEALQAVAQPDGKVLVLTTGNCLVRYNIDGTLDGLFGSAGRIPADFGGAGTAATIALAPDGSIVVAGAINGNSVLARYHTDGSLDLAFGNDGQVILDLAPGRDDAATNLAVQADGKIVLAGYARLASGGTDQALARLTVDGSLDITFDTDGKAFTHLGNPCSIPGRWMAIQSDGKIVVAEGDGVSVNRTNWLGIVRYNTDGRLDSGFGIAGIVAGTVNFAARGMALTADGKIMIAGDTTKTGSNNEVIPTLVAARYNADGKVDTTFGDTGIATMAVPAGNAYAYALLVQPDGKPVLVGSAGRKTAGVWDSDVFVARFTADGSADTAFGTGGMRMVDVGSLDDLARSATFGPNGAIVVAGRRAEIAAQPTGQDVAVLRLLGSEPQVTAANVAPTAALTNSGPIMEGSIATVSFSDMFDPSPADLAAGFRYSYDFDNDGTFDITDSDSPTAAVPASRTAQGPATLTVRARIADRRGAFTDYTTDLVVQDSTPLLQSVRINGGQAQRSVVRTLTVSFDQSVTLDPGAFELLGPPGSAVTLAVQPEEDGRTFTVTFSGPDVFEGSVPDGDYRFLVRADRVHNAISYALGGGDQTALFHRLSADANGDRTVDVGDLGMMGASYGMSGPSLPGDMNDDGFVDVGDLGILGVHYGQTLPPGDELTSPAPLLADKPAALSVAPSTMAPPGQGQPATTMPATASRPADSLSIRAASNTSAAPAENESPEVSPTPPATRATLTDNLVVAAPGLIDVLGLLPLALPLADVLTLG